MATQFPDVDIQRQTLDELARAYEQQARTFDTALSHITDFVYILDVDGRFVYVNQALLALWGLTLEQAKGKNFFDLQYPDDLAIRLHKQVKETVESRRRVVGETAYVSPAGVSGYYEYIFNPIFDADGDVQGIAGSTRVITERKRAEEQTVFLSRLGQRLALLRSPEEIGGTTTKEVGEFLQAHRCYICEWDADMGRAVVTADWCRDDASSLVGEYELTHYGTKAWWEALTAGNVAIDDFETHFLARDFLDAYRQLRIRSYATARFKRKSGSMATLVVTMPEARSWRPDELVLLENVVARAWPLVERARAEHHAAFLERLSERLSLANDPEIITQIAIEMVGEHLHVHRCYFFETVEGTDRVRVTENWHRPGVRSIAGEYAFHDFGTADWWSVLRTQRVLVDNVSLDPRVDAERCATLQIQAFATVPFSREGKWLVGLAVTSEVARRWDETELRLLENVIARVWPAVERARVSVALHESAERLSLAMAAADLGDFSWDVKTDRVVLSERAAALYGVDPVREISREKLRELLHEDDRERARFANDRAMAARTDYNVEYRVRTAHGGCRWIAARGRCTYAPDGSPLGMQGVIQDITGRKVTEETLRVQEAQLRAHANELEARVQERTASLQEAITQMEEFSYSVSHDLRGPLRAMNQYAHVLLEDYGPRLEPTAREYLARIQNSSHRMEKLTQDVLTYSRVARAQVGLRPIELRTLIDDVVHQYVELQPPNATVEKVEPLYSVLGHEASLGQCLSNLLSNAAKFVRPGVKPHIRVSTIRAGDRVRIWIVDNGIGIPVEHQVRIFQVFERLPTEARYEGTGIGLAIVRKAMEKMGGNCGVESDGANGSSFWLELAAG